MEDVQTKQSKPIMKIEFIWYLILASDLFLNYLPSSLYFLTLLLLIIKSSRIELSFIMIFFPGIMFVDALNNTLLDGNKALLIMLFLGVMLIAKDLWRLRSGIFQTMLPLLIILIGFLITYIYAPKGYYSGYKIVSVIVRGIASFLFFIVFLKTYNFNNTKFSLFLLFLFIFYLKIAYAIGVIYTPNGVLDAGFIRHDLDETLPLGINYPGYHQFGALAMYAIIFLISWTKKLNLFYVLIIILGTYLGFLSGARQMIFGIILVLGVYLIRYHRNSLIIMVPIIFFIASYGAFNVTDIKIPFVSDFLFNEDAFRNDGRNALYEKAIRIFEENPIFGAGIGGFDLKGRIRDYPHNIILEVLSEGGLFMISIITVTLYYVKKSSQFKWWNKTSNGTVFLFLIFGLTIRAFSSSDLIENICLISALCAIGINRNTLLLDKTDHRSKVKNF